LGYKEKATARLRDSWDSRGSPKKKCSKEAVNFFPGTGSRGAREAGFDNASKPLYEEGAQETLTVFPKTKEASSDRPSRMHLSKIY